MFSAKRPTKSALPGATEVAMFRPLVEVWQPDSSTIFAPPVGLEPTTDRLEKIMINNEAA
jgi:hypothetical protein